MIKIAAKIPFNVRAAQVDTKPERQTAILYDDEENEEDEEMMKNKEDAHDNVEHTEIDDDDQQVDNVELQSNAVIGSSHITGKWWFGKSTK